MFRQRPYMKFEQRLSCASRWSYNCPSRHLLYMFCLQGSCRVPMHMHARSQPRCPHTTLMSFCWM